MHGNVAEWVLRPAPRRTSSTETQRRTTSPWLNPLVWPTELYPRVVRGRLLGRRPGQTCAPPRGVCSRRKASWKVQDPQLPKSIWYHTDAPFVGFRVVRPFRGTNRGREAAATGRRTWTAFARSVEIQRIGRPASAEIASRPGRAPTTRDPSDEQAPDEGQFPPYVPEAVVRRALVARWGSQTPIAAGGTRCAATTPCAIALIGCGLAGARRPAGQALSTKGDVTRPGGRWRTPSADRVKGSLEQPHQELPGSGGRPGGPPVQSASTASRRPSTPTWTSVILTTPPGFRPAHFEYAMSTRHRHVFMEKPVAVDAPGIRQVLAAGEKAAQEKNLKVGVGLQRHHDRQVPGDRSSGSAAECHRGPGPGARLTGTAAASGCAPVTEGMSEMEYQMAQLVLLQLALRRPHRRDSTSTTWTWATGWSAPIRSRPRARADARCGPARTTARSTTTTWWSSPTQNGTKMLRPVPAHQGVLVQQCQRVRPRDPRAPANIGDIRVTMGGERWKLRGRQPLRTTRSSTTCCSTRSARDLPHNETEYGAKSTMTSILGRMATYSGKMIQWDEALASNLALVPRAYAWDAAPPTVPDENGRYPIPGSGGHPGLLIHADDGETTRVQASHHRRPGAWFPPSCCWRPWRCPRRLPQTTTRTRSTRRAAGRGHAHHRGVHEQAAPRHARRGQGATRPGAGGGPAAGRAERQVGDTAHGRPRCPRPSAGPSSPPTAAWSAIC